MPIEGLVILGSLAALPLFFLLVGVIRGYRKEGDVLLAKEIIADYENAWRTAFSSLGPGEKVTTWPLPRQYDALKLGRVLKDVNGVVAGDSWQHTSQRRVQAEFPEIRGYERCLEDGQWPSVIEGRRLIEEAAARKLLVRQPLDRRVEARVLREGGGKCAYCDRHARTLEIDHIIPWSVSHDDSYDNLVVACTRCNRSKGAKSGDALRRWLRRVNCGHPKVMAAAGRAA